jgi:hypothetical protein
VGEALIFNAIFKKSYPFISQVVVLNFTEQSLIEIPPQKHADVQET